MYGQVGIGHFDAPMSFILGCCEKLLTLNCRNRVGVMIPFSPCAPTAKILVNGIRFEGQRQRVKPSGAQSVARQRF